MKKLLLSAALLLASTGTASAYTSYLLPQGFWHTQGEVTLEAAWASTFFTPQVALGVDYVVTMPDGSPGALTRVEVGSQATQLASPLHDYGTYRFSTGEQLGAVSTLVGVDGAWRPLAAGETPPADAPTTTIQTVSLAETYVTRGAPTRAAVDAASGRLTIKPVTHPNQVLTSQGMLVQLLFDGRPFANVPVVLYASGEPDSDQDRFVVTDANGMATLTFDAPGQYIATARHRANAPAGAAAQVQSYTTSLTFEALAQLHPVGEVPRYNRRERRRY